MIDQMFKKPIKMMRPRQTAAVLSHNKGIVNIIYLNKAGKCARYKIGEILEIPDDYHRETWQLVKKVIDDLATAVIPKLPVV